MSERMIDAVTPSLQSYRTSNNDSTDGDDIVMTDFHDSYFQTGVFDDKDFKDSSQFLLNKEEILKVDPQLRLKYELIPMKVTVYAPKVFNYLR